jgi:lipopolysaccharide/colanic/teichoic acid biosynthesis glycosyltransferase
MAGSFYVRYGKRIFDLIFGFLGFVLISPLLLIISLWILIGEGRPILFLHERMGKNFQKFNLIKFRTMIKNADRMGPQVTGGNDARISNLGQHLRRLKLDELPQLINVLKGEMSIVGPRPEVEQYVDQFKPEYQKVLKIKPGITDFAAIEFRKEQEILKEYEDINTAYITKILPRKLELYQIYMREISLLTDLKIIFRTLRSIL